MMTALKTDIEDLRRLVSLARAAKERIRKIGSEHVKEVKLNETIFENWYLSVALDDGRIKIIVLDEEKDGSKGLKRLEQEIGPRTNPPCNLMP